MKTIILLTILLLVLASCAPKQEPENCLCITVYEPVCGSDGKTYSNTCVAACAGITNSSPGECTS